MRQAGNDILGIGGSQKIRVRKSRTRREVELDVEGGRVGRGGRETRTGREVE